MAVCQNYAVVEFPEIEKQGFILWIYCNDQVASVVEVQVYNFVISLYETHSSSPWHLLSAKIVNIR